MMMTENKALRKKNIKHWKMYIWNEGKRKKKNKRMKCVHLHYLFVSFDDTISHVLDKLLFLLLHIPLSLLRLLTHTFAFLYRILTRVFFYYLILFLRIMCACVCMFDFHRFDIFFFLQSPYWNLKWIYVCNTQAIFVHRHRAHTHTSEKNDKREYVKRQLFFEKKANREKK